MVLQKQGGKERRTRRGGESDSAQRAVKGKKGSAVEHSFAVGGPGAT
jgi:hypothetical protein